MWPELKRRFFQRIQMKMRSSVQVLVHRQVSFYYKWGNWTQRTQVERRWNHKEGGIRSASMYGAPLSLLVSRITHIVTLITASFLLMVNSNLWYKHVYFQSVHGNSNSTSSYQLSTSLLSASSSMGLTHSINSDGGNQKCNQEQNKNQYWNASTDKIKDKARYSLKDK